MGSLRSHSSSDQMGYHRTNLFAIEGLIDEPVDSEIDGLFKKSVPFLGDDQKNSRTLDFFDFDEKVLLSDTRRINIEDDHIENIFGKMILDLKTIIKNRYKVAFSLQAFSKIAPAG
jgi:hypothetical protein